MFDMSSGVLEEKEETSIGRWDDGNNDERSRREDFSPKSIFNKRGRGYWCSLGHPPLLSPTSTRTPKASPSTK